MKDDGVTQYHVPREQFERDIRRGYTVKKWQPSTKHRELAGNGFHQIA